MFQPRPDDAVRPSVEQPTQMTIGYCILLVAAALGGVVLGAVLWDRALRNHSPLPRIPLLTRSIESSDEPTEPEVPEGKRVRI